MKGYLSQLSIFLLLSIALLACSSDNDNPSTSSETETASYRTVISTLSIPWELIWGPDDYLWLSERNGRISRIHPDTGEQTIIANLGNTIQQIRESGLLGMVLHPNFTATPYVYLVYTYNNGGNLVERLSRFTYTNNSLANEVVLVDNIPAGTTHNGSRLLITPDNHILMTTGDAGTPSVSQNINSLAGKVLRINLDGSIPSDNPNPNSYVYSIGHRNAQGLAMHPNGNIYSSEHGPNSDDEINIIEANGNYGWPNVLGVINTNAEQQFHQNTPTIPSIADWTPTVAPSDLIIYNHSRIPEWNNKLLLATLREQAIIALTLSNDGSQITEKQHYFQNQFGRIRDLVMAPDGRLFIATNGNSYTDTSNTHQIIEINALSN